MVMIMIMTAENILPNEYSHVIVSPQYCSIELPVVALILGLALVALTLCAIDEGYAYAMHCYAWVRR